MSDVKLMLGDCLDLMRGMDAGSIDCVITDPPYGIGYQSNSATVNRFDVLVNDDVFDLSDYWADISMVTKSGGAIYLYSRWDVAYKWQEIVCPDSQIIIPRGRVSMGDLDDYSDEYEAILFRRIGKHVIDATQLGIRNNSHAKNPPVFKKRIGNLWSDIVCNEAWERADHPTQKTVESAARMILVSTRAGDTVFDPFMGSGTTGVACVKLGRNFIGMEINPTYFAIAQKRVAESQLQIPMLLPA